MGPQNFKAPVKSGPKRQPPTPPAKRSKAEKSEPSSEPSPTSPAGPQNFFSGLSVKEELSEASAGNSRQGLRQEVATGSADAPAFAHAPNPEEPPSDVQEEAAPTPLSGAVVTHLAPGAETEASASESVAPARVVTTSPQEGSDTEETECSSTSSPTHQPGPILSEATVRVRRSQHADAPLASRSDATKALGTGREEVRTFTGHLNRWPTCMPNHGGCLALGLS